MDGDEDEAVERENSDDVEAPHWFTGRDADVLIYKVNRRPLGAGTLFAEMYAERQPPDVLKHLQENLLNFDPVAFSGTSVRRRWRLGNIAVNPRQGLLTGRLGWFREGEAITSDWDEGRRAWVERVVPGGQSAVTPVAFIREGRYLGVLKHPGFNPNVIAKVLRDLLNDAEVQKDEPTTSFDVEPVGDEDDFFEWLEETPTVTSLRFVFKRPNPDGEDAFQELFERLDRLEARKIQETITAHSDQEGLSKSGIATDRSTQAFIRAAMSAFGYLVGRGRRRSGRSSLYDQRERMAHQRVEGVGASWESATDQVAEATRQFRPKRGSGGDQAS